MENEIEYAETKRPQYFPGENQPTTKSALERAKKENLKVVYPGPRQLQIDIDGTANLLIFVDHFAILKKYLGADNFTLIPSLSEEAGHFHITVNCNRYFNPLERIALQALLGSDLKRETLGFIMAKNGESKPTLFLEKK